MTSTQQHTLKYAALAVWIALSIPQAKADLSVGSVYGQAPTGSSISIKNLDTGLKRELTVDAKGRFVFSQLPTGRYQLSGNGQTLDLSVVIGTGTPVNLNQDNAERIAVFGSRINRIDTSSVEASTVFSAEQLANLPIGRDVSDVALLAPGTVRGDSGFGKLASSGGASVAENG